MRNCQIRAMLLLAKMNNHHLWQSFLTNLKSITSNHLLVLILSHFLKWTKLQLQRSTHHFHKDLPKGSVKNINDSSPSQPQIPGGQEKYHLKHGIKKVTFSFQNNENEEGGATVNAQENQTVTAQMGQDCQEHNSQYTRSSQRQP